MDYLIDEKTLTSFANSARGIYNKTGILTGQQIVDDIKGIVDEVEEQRELIDKISRKFIMRDEFAYLEGTLEDYYDSNVDSVRDFAFDTYTSLTSIDLPNTTSIGSSAFNNCNSLTSIYLPNATSIGGSAFYNCNSLTSIYLPNATSIGGSAFEICTALTTVNLPNVASIGDYAFYNCNSLTTVDLPNATSIGDYAFGYCDSLTTLIIRTNSVCTLGGTSALSHTPSTGYIYVPATLIESYRTATNWSTYKFRFRTIEDYPEICGEVTK